MELDYTNIYQFNNPNNFLTLTSWKHHLQIPNWYHFSCFWKRGRPKNTDEIHGYHSLRWEDQEKIKEKIGAGSVDTFFFFFVICEHSYAVSLVKKKFSKLLVTSFVALIWWFMIVSPPILCIGVCIAVSFLV